MKRGREPEISDKCAKQPWAAPVRVPSSTADQQLSEDSDASSSGRSDALREQVSDVPLGVLARLKADGAGLTGKAARKAAEAALQKQYKRENKHRPSELSSKKPVSRLRQVVEIPRREAVDPRFEDVSGHYDKDVFRKRYRFLYEDVLPEEKRTLQEKYKKEKVPRFKKELQSKLQRVQQQLQEEQQRRKTHEIESGIKTKEKAAVEAGKKPYYMKKSELKRLELLAKYEELKSKGKLEKYMEKRRRKNAAKDHRYVPSSRREVQ